MNLRSLINYQEAINLAIGISVDTNHADQPVYSYCILQRKNNIIRINKLRDEINSIGELKQELGELIQSGVRVHLNFTGKTILHKPIAESASTISQVVQQAFPFLQADEIVAQVHNTSKEIILSVIRKSIVAGVDALFVDENSWSAITLGPFGIERLSMFMDDKILLLDGFEITISQGKATYKPAFSAGLMNGEILLGNEKIKQSYLPSYGAAFQIFVPLATTKDSGYSVLDKGRQQILRNQQFFKFGRIALILVLAVLLINAGVYFWLKGKTAAMHQVVESVAGVNEAKQAVFTRNRQLQHVFQQLGWSENLLPLYYADQIGTTIIPEIKLTELEVGVLNQTQLRQEKKYLFQPFFIHVKGIADTPVALHQWLASLEKLEWVNEIQDQRYQINPRHGKGEFQLILSVR